MGILRFLCANSIEEVRGYLYFKNIHIIVPNIDIRLLSELKGGDHVRYL